VVNQSLRSGRSVATDLHSLHASAYGAEENEQVNEEEKFNQAFNFAVKTAEEHSVGSKPRSKIIMVSSQVEYERQAQTLAAYVKTMTDEFMSNFEFMQADLRKAQQQRNLQRGQTPKQQAQFKLTFSEKDDMSGSARSQRSSQGSAGSAEYTMHMVPPTSGRNRETFQQKKEGGVMRTVKEQQASNGVIQQVCDNGHDLYVTHWTKKGASSNCSKCKSKISYKDKMVTCTQPSCETTTCMNCSGCVNGHVVHRRIIGDTPLTAKNNSCLRCATSLTKELSVKWCNDCNQAYCPAGCQHEMKRID